MEKTLHKGLVKMINFDVAEGFSKQKLIRPLEYTPTETV
jgi:hypothetical protein